MDLDEVIRSFTTQLKLVYKREYPDHKIKPITSYEMSTWFPIGKQIWNFIYKDHVTEIFEEAPICNGALEMLIRLEAEGHEIQLITAQPKTAVAPTLNWIRKNNLPYQSIHFELKKYNVWTDIFLDDNTENLEAMQNEQARVLSVAFHRPWNKDWTGPRIEKHSEIFDIIDVVKKFRKANRWERGYA